MSSKALDLVMEPRTSCTAESNSLEIQEKQLFLLSPTICHLEQKQNMGTAEELHGYVFGCGARDCEFDSPLGLLDKGWTL